MAQLEYLTKIMQVIEKIDKEQSENIQAAADLCAATIHSGKLVHLFGSGHSVLPVQDVFPRYGGVVGWHPVMDPRLMWNNVIGPGGARELLWIERQEGYIANFLQSYNFQEGEVMIVFSHGKTTRRPPPPTPPATSWATWRTFSLTTAARWRTRWLPFPVIIRK